MNIRGTRKTETLHCGTSVIELINPIKHSKDQEKKRKVITVDFDCKKV